MKTSILETYKGFSTRAVKLFFLSEDTREKNNKFQGILSVSIGMDNLQNMNFVSPPIIPVSCAMRREGLINIV